MSPNCSSLDVEIYCKGIQRTLKLYFHICRALRLVCKYYCAAVKGAYGILGSKLIKDRVGKAVAKSHIFLSQPVLRFLTTCVKDAVILAFSKTEQEGKTCGEWDGLKPGPAALSCMACGGLLDTLS